MKKNALPIFLCLLFALLAVAPAHGARLTRAGGPGDPAGGDRAGVIIDFRDVDIRMVARFISDLTGKNFVFDKQVQDKVTVFSPTKVTPVEAYRLFETVLKIHGYTTVPSEGVIKITTINKARTMDVETRPRLPAKSDAPEDRVVTQLVRLHFADAKELVPLLKPLMDRGGLLSAYDSGNTLVVTDYASNIDRLLKILNAVDKPEEGTKLTVIPLKHASAKDLASELQEVLKAPAKTARGVQRPGLDYKVVADERTNKLIVMARANELAIIRNLARNLDVPARRGSDRVHVYFLKHAVAEELAEVLNNLAAAAGVKQQSGQAAPKAVLLQENVFITAEKATNSLIIRAERQDFLVLKDIIGQLDIQRPQVLVEGIIMEMSVQKANALGAEWRTLDLPSGSGRVVVGGTNLPDSSGAGLINQLASQPFAGPAGLVLGAAEGTITWGGATFLNIGLLIQALEQDSEVDILSTPHILTMDNEEARIVVGEERPFLKSSMSTATGAVTASVTNTYEFKDLGLTLKITPHITQGDYIKLNIFQQLKSFISEAETGAVSSTKREAETTVLVKSGETVVIGGLIGDESRQNKSQVPCFGDIPFLGWAFKRRAQSGNKQNLLILINPTIIRTAEQLREKTDEKLIDHERAGDKAKKKKDPPPSPDSLKILED